MPQLTPMPALALADRDSGGIAKVEAVSVDAAANAAVSVVGIVVRVEWLFRS